MARRDSSKKPAVLITGCSSGIGKATAAWLARRGHNVWATARRKQTLADLEAKGCRTLSLDVNDEDSMRAAVKAVEDADGAVGVLVNNAGYSQSGAIEAVPMERVRAQFETNVFGAVRMMQLVLPGMRRAGRGRIVNVSSMGGKLVFPGGGFYHASKYAIEAISDALRFEVRAFGIDVVVIEPGLIKSGFAEAALGEMKMSDGEDPYAHFHAEVARLTKESYEQGPMSKLAGVPDDVARAIEKAINARRPKTRYTVSPSATVMLCNRRWSSDRMWDFFMRMSFPSPGGRG